MVAECSFALDWAAQELEPVRARGYGIDEAEIREDRSWLSGSRFQQSVGSTRPFTQRGRAGGETFQLQGHLAGFLGFIAF